MGVVRVTDGISTAILLQPCATGNWIGTLPSWAIQCTTGLLLLLFSCPAVVTGDVGVARVETDRKQKL